MYRHILTWAAGLALAMALVGCSNKAPAEAALKVADEAVAQAKGAAAKLVPEQMQSLENALASAKDKLAKGEYKDAIAEAQALPSKAKEVLAAAEAKKAELTAGWSTASEGLPKMLEAIKGRVDSLAGAKKLPEGITSESLESAKTSLAEVTEGWAKAQESFKAGDLSAALAGATALKDKAAKAMQLLGMPAAPEAKS